MFSSNVSLCQNYGRISELDIEAILCKRKLVLIKHELKHELHRR